MRTTLHATTPAVCMVLLFSSLSISQTERKWKETFPEDSSHFFSRGANPYFILEPGHQLHLKDNNHKEMVELVITVLEETRIVDGVETRIVEERETANGTLVEVSRNFFAIGRRTNNVYYFGEEVDIYKEGKVVSHDGAWESGVDGAHYGLMIPGNPVVGFRFYQERAPGIAMDRAEIVSLNESVITSAGRLDQCLKSEETTPLEPEVKEFKHYARGIGLIKDGDLVLVLHGFLKK